MAELAIGIGGLVLAWKGIIDFGSFIVKILEDDSPRRTVLFLTLTTSEFRLKDWGDHWGIDRDDGKFHSFEPQRKQLIIWIIFTLRDSRTEAVKRLRDRYGLTLENEEECEENEAPKEYKKGEKFVKMLNKVKQGLKAAKDKGMWLAFDQELINQLVIETKELHECLQCLTYGSGQFVCGIFPHVQEAPSQAARVSYMNRTNTDITQSIQRRHSYLCNSPVEFQDDRTSVDEQTAIGFAARSIISSAQAVRFQQNTDKALHFYGDARIPEAIRMWLDDKSKILILEASDSADDESSTLTCALVHYLSSGQAITYSFDREISVSAEIRFIEMVRDLIRSMVALQTNTPFSNAVLPAGYDIAELNNRPANAEGIRWTIAVFHHLLRFFVSNYNKRITITIDGMDLVAFDDSGNPQRFVQAFVTGIRSICVEEANSDSTRANLKVLLGCKGHVMALAGCVGDQDILDITDHPSQTMNILQEISTYY